MTNEEHIQNTQDILFREQDTRELGKWLAPIVERSVAPEWLSNNGFENEPAPLDSEGQQEKYDIITTPGGIRIQVKYRGGKSKAAKGVWVKDPRFSGKPKLHLENTRRASGKNAENAKNGQVPSKITDFDYYLFAIPTGRLEDFEKYVYLVIPPSEIEDDKNPGFVANEVSAVTIEKWLKIDPVETLRNHIPN